MRKTPLICLTGPSGVGKTAISYVLKETYGFSLVVSYTSRRRRPLEVDGVDYHFRTQKWLKDHREMFHLDWSVFNGNIYGASDEDLHDKDILVIQADDVLMLRDMGLPVFFVWINGPSRDPRGRKEDVRWRREYSRQVNHILHNPQGRTLGDCANEVNEIWKILKSGT